MKKKTAPKKTTVKKKVTAKKKRVKKAEANYERVKKTSKFGEGKRFPALVEVFEAKGMSEKRAKGLAGDIYRGKK